MGLKPALKNEPPADRRAAQRKTHKCVAQLARDRRSRFTSPVWVTEPAHSPSAADAAEDERLTGARIVWELHEEEDGQNDEIQYEKTHDHKDHYRRDLHASVFNGARTTGACR